MRVHFRVLILFGVLGSLAGCASGALAPSQQKAIQTIEVNSRPVADWKGQKCEAPSRKSQESSLKDLVGSANGCVAQEKWVAVQEWGQLLAQRFPLSPWGPYYQSLVAESEGQLDRALWLAEMSQKRGGGAPLLLYQKGRILWKRNESREATDTFFKAIQLDPALADAHLILGQILYRDQEFSKAAGHYQAVLQSRPKDSQALMGLAECQIQAGDARGALELLERGQKHHPADVEFPLRSAFTHETLLNDNVRALEVLKSVQAGVNAGRFSKAPGFDLGQKISVLESALNGSRAVASQGAGGKK